MVDRTCFYTASDKLVKLKSRHRIGGTTTFDPAFPLYARSFLARGRLYEELGEREKAAQAYQRFLALWKDADPEFQPQLREARAGLARVRDAGRGQAVR